MPQFLHALWITGEIFFFGLCFDVAVMGVYGALKWRREMEQRLIEQQEENIALALALLFYVQHVTITVRRVRL